MVTKYDKRQNMVSSHKYKAGNVVKLNTESRKPNDGFFPQMSYVLS